MVQVPSQHFPPPESQAPPPRPASPRAIGEATERGAGLGLGLSVGFHILGLLALIAFAFFAPSKPSTVPVFELVNLNPPKLRPLRPKVQKPPDPPPPEPARPTEAPKLTTRPEKAVTPQKPEPKVVREDPDTTLKPSETMVEEEQNLSRIVAHIPSDPRLALWAGRVKKKAEAMWNPPSGIDILGRAVAVVKFTVARDGLISDAVLTGSAGNEDLDIQALQTIQRMERVPPLPENFPEDAIQVSYEFVYKGQ